MSDYFFLAKKLILILTRDLDRSEYIDYRPLWELVEKYPEEYEKALKRQPPITFLKGKMKLENNTMIEMARTMDEEQLQQFFMAFGMLGKKNAPENKSLDYLIYPKEHPEWYRIQFMTEQNMNQVRCTSVCQEVYQEWRLSEEQKRYQVLRQRLNQHLRKVLFDGSQDTLCEIFQNYQFSNCFLQAITLMPALELECPYLMPGNEYLEKQEQRFIEQTYEEFLNQTLDYLIYYYYQKKETQKERRELKDLFDHLDIAEDWKKEKKSQQPENIYPAGKYMKELPDAFYAVHFTWYLTVSWYMSKRKDELMQNMLREDKNRLANGRMQRLDQVQEENRKLKEELEKARATIERLKELDDNAELTRLRKQNQKLARDCEVYQRKLKETSESQVVITQADPEKERERKALKEENRQLSEALKRSKQPTLLQPGTEPDLFTNEGYQIVMSILTDAERHCKNEGRKKDVLRGILEANPYHREVEQRKQMVKDTLKGYRNITDSIQKSLKECGIEAMPEQRKHYKMIYYKDPRYVVTIAATPSKSRSGIEAALNICNQMF